MTTENIEERVRQLEGTSRTHDAMLNLLLSLGERQQALLEEVRRDAQQTHRLWVRLARKYGWLEAPRMPQVQEPSLGQALSVAAGGRKRHGLTPSALWCTS